MAPAGLGLRAPPVGCLSVQSATDRSFVVSVRTQRARTQAAQRWGNRPASARNPIMIISSISLRCDQSPRWHFAGGRTLRCTGGGENGQMSRPMSRLAAGAVGSRARSLPSASATNQLPHTTTTTTTTTTTHKERCTLTGWQVDLPSWYVGCSIRR